MYKKAVIAWFSIITASRFAVTSKAFYSQLPVAINQSSLAKRTLMSAMTPPGGTEEGKGSSENVGRGSQKRGSRPIEDVSDKTWRERIDVSIAKSRKIRGGNYVQIATVDADGHPRCRTVVFRGFSAFSHSPYAMKMITDSRSEKVSQIALSPQCEMVWWFSQSSEQYRITGSLQLVSGEETSEELLAARKQQWGNLSDPAREQFYWRQPGVTFEGAPDVPAGGRDEDGKVLSPPDTFLLMLLHPVSVKYLRLTDNMALLDEAASSSGACSRDDNSWLPPRRVNP